MFHPSAAVRRAACVALAFAGLTASTGCLYVPSSYTTQGNGKPRPESIIGKDDRSLIVLGKTRIDEAMPRVAEQIAALPAIDPERLDLRSLLTGEPFAALTDFKYLSINVERRQIAIPYRLKTGWFLYPFAVRAKTNSRLLVLTTDDKGVVVAKDTIEPADLAGRSLRPLDDNPAELMKLLDVLLRGKLGESGLFDLH